MSTTPELAQLPTQHKLRRLPKVHKLGSPETRDLGEMRKELAEKLDRIISKSLSKFEDGIDKIPARFLAVPIGIMIDKRLALDHGPNMATTTNNTVVINGFTRGEAMMFLNGGKAGDGLPIRTATNLNNASLSSITLQEHPSALPDTPNPAPLSTKTP